MAALAPRYRTARKSRPAGRPVVRCSSTIVRMMNGGTSSNEAAASTNSTTSARSDRARASADSPDGRPATWLRRCRGHRRGPGDSSSGHVGGRHLGIELRSIDACVQAGRGDQLGVPSELLDLAVLQHHDQIGLRKRRQAVRAKNDRARGLQRARPGRTPVSATRRCGPRSKRRPPRTDRRGPGDPESAARPWRSPAPDPTRWRWPPERRTPSSPISVSGREEIRHVLLQRRQPRRIHQE